MHLEERRSEEEQRQQDTRRASDACLQRTTLRDTIAADEFSSKRALIRRQTEEECASEMRSENQKQQSRCLNRLLEAIERQSVGSNAHPNDASISRSAERLAPCICTLLGH